MLHVATSRLRLAAVLCLVGVGARAHGGEPSVASDQALPEYIAPEPNRSDEPLAAAASAERAAGFLDAAALDWQQRRKCMTCHTNYAYLYARPALDPAQSSAAHAAVRRFAEELVTERWEDAGPRWDAEVVATAAALAFNDASTTGKLHPVTRRALDRMWTVQKEDGHWDWLKCDWPPMEIDDHYGAALAAVAVGVAPEGYADSPAAREGMQRLRSWLAANPPPGLHHQAMLVWAASYTPDLISAEEREKCVAALLAQQRPDGGWSAATLGEWQRRDGGEQDTTTSDGYGTGFVVYVLLRGGVAADHPAVLRGVDWLVKNQRESGRWFARSLYADNHHFLSHAGTAFAVMALAESGASGFSPAAEAEK